MLSVRFMWSPRTCRHTTRSPRRACRARPYSDRHQTVTTCGHLHLISCCCSLGCKPPSHLPLSSASSSPCRAVPLLCRQPPPTSGHTSSVACCRPCALLDHPERPSSTSQADGRRISPKLLCHRCFSRKGLTTDSTLQPRNGAISLSPSYVASLWSLLAELSATSSYGLCSRCCSPMSIHCHHHHLSPVSLRPPRSPKSTRHAAVVLLPPLLPASRSRWAAAMGAPLAERVPCFGMGLRSVWCGPSAQYSFSNFHLIYLNQFK
jgi:hypothetical protein